ncbi:MAG: hypothetical protein C3F08_08115 [Candidatus Methylomirabilota bacterium]|nr:MAG: hypothetical protein C3F08_08115 [candidate division NC10 bacterium]
MARAADDVGTGSDPLYAMRPVTGDTISAWAVTAKLGMSALANLVMEFLVTCAATDPLRRCGVGPFRDVGMAFHACQRMVRRLSQVGRIDEQ